MDLDYSYRWSVEFVVFPAPGPRQCHKCMIATDSYPRLAAELIGWAGRTWSAECPYNQNAYLMQITTLIIAPVFFTGALYIVLGNLINILGRESSLLSAKMYTIVFLSCDVISLVVQVCLPNNTMVSC